MTGRLGSLVGAAGRAVTARRAAPGGVVLAYHDVDPSGPAGSDWTISADRLGEHIRLIRRLGLELVDLATIVDRLLAGGSVERMAALTFDDALVGLHDHGLDVLVTEGAPATVFVVSGSPGTAPSWWPGARRTMDRDELARAVSCGVRIGAHTRSHSSLPALGRADRIEELAGCRSDLEDVWGTTVDLLAYPFGHHDAGVRADASSAGYRAAFTFLNGRITSGDDPLRLPRLTMGGHMTSRRLAYHLLRSVDSWPDHQLDEVSGPR